MTIKSIYVVQEKKTYDEYSITSVHNICTCISYKRALERAELLASMLSESEKEIIKFEINEIPLIVPIEVTLNEDQFN